MRVKPPFPPGIRLLTATLPGMGGATLLIAMPAPRLATG
jgi:hypothetical protein